MKTIHSLLLFSLTLGITVIVADETAARLNRKTPAIALPFNDKLAQTENQR